MNASKNPTVLTRRKLPGQQVTVDAALVPPGEANVSTPGYRLTLLLSLVLTLAFHGISTPASAARTWSVPSEVSTIQAAIDSSAAGDTVLVSPGTYREALSIVAKDIALLSSDGVSTTVLSGEHFAVPAPPILYLNTVDSTSTIGGFTFSMAPDSTRTGGAILCEAYLGEYTYCAPLIRGNRFVGNRAALGGAICVAALAAPTITENEFTGNIAAWSGGAIYLDWDTHATIEQNSFQENSLRPAFAAVSVGGAIAIEGLFADGPNNMIAFNLFVRNDAEYGGAISIAWGNCILTGNTFTENRVASLRVAPTGSAIRLYRSVAELQNNLVAFNEGAAALKNTGPGTVSTACNDVYGNHGGDYDGLAPSPSDISEDPEFCSPPSGAYDVAASSPCLPENNTCGLIGARGEGCAQTVGVLEPPASRTMGLVCSRDSVGNIRIWSSQRSSMNSATLEIFDVHGRLLYRAGWASMDQPFVLRRGGTFLGRVPPGVYFLTATGPNLFLRGRLVFL